MGVTIKIISGTDGAGFQTALDTAIAAGERPIGNAWSDGTNSYQEVEVHDDRERFYNPDILSRVWRAKNTLGPGETFPTSSKLSAYEYNVLYNPSSFHSIGGTITSASLPMENVTMSFSPDVDTVYTNASGIYSQDVPDGWDGTVTPASASGVFSPTDRNYSNVQLEQSGQDYILT